MTTETSNFALENAVVVHNCGGLRKVRTPNQGLLPLKGKIMNAIKARGDKALLSQAVLNILGAIGFDPKVEDPLKKLQVGRLVFLSDADPDGPLHGNTRVKLLDGTTPTMKQLAARWLVDQTPIWVWGVTPEGATKPVQAILPRQVKVVNKLLKITFDDGTVVKCTPNHKWAVNYSSHTIGAKTSSVHHVKAQYLSPGDSVVGVDFDHTGRKSRKYQRLRELVQRERTNHKVVSVKEIDAPGTPVYCMTVPETSNFLLEDKNGNGIASGNSHINCLLHVLIARYLPGMYEQGMVYVADMPEFYSIVKDQIFTGDTLSEVQGKLKSAKVKGDVLHAKGWGEVDPQVLKILAVDSSRRLIKIDPLTDQDRSQFFSLMGKGDGPAEDTGEE